MVQSYTINLHTSKPVRNVFARASKCAPGNDESTVIGTSRTHSIVGVSAHHGAVKIVSIVFNPATWVNNVGVGSAVSQCRTRSLSAILLGDKLCCMNDTHPAPF
jgi:hypothetical protein